MKTIEEMRQIASKNKINAAEKQWNDIEKLIEEYSSKGETSMYYHGDILQENKDKLTKWGARHCDMFNYRTGNAVIVDWGESV